MVHWVCHGLPTVCDPPSVSPVLSHCIPCMAEYQPSKAAYSTSKRCACSALTVHAGEPNTAPVHFYCVAHFYTCSSTLFSPALSAVIPQFTKWSSHCRQRPLHRDGGSDCSTARYAPCSVTTHECTSQYGRCAPHIAGTDEWCSPSHVGHGSFVYIAYPHTVSAHFSAFL